MVEQERRYAVPAAFRLPDLSPALPTSAPGTRHVLAVTAGRLAARERAVVRRVRADFPAAWRGAVRRHRRWLR